MSQLTSDFRNFPNMSAGEYLKGRREPSPDISLFSSASASLDRCSFASDSLSLASSDLSNPHYVGVEGYTFNEVKVNDIKVLDPPIPKGVDAPRNSFSIAVKECQERKSRTDAGDMKNEDVSSSQTPFIFQNVGKTMNKGWMSECGTPNPESKHHFYHSVTGRPIPSKWEDADRWIISPGSTQAHQTAVRKLKSKSGPLAPLASVNRNPLDSSLPTFGADYVARKVQLENCSPFLLAASEPFIARSASLHGSSDEVSLRPTRSIQGEVRRRDAATEMIPIGGDSSSKGGRVSLLDITRSIMEDSDGFKDVEVDEKVTVRMWSRRHKSKKNVKKRDDDMRSRDGMAKVSVQSNCEDGKITAWENLQKVRAETEIRKLEMKLERKRTSSMEKIINKLKCAQKKAEEKRSSLSSDGKVEIRSTISFRGCFFCSAF